MDKNELGQLKDHADGIFEKLKASHKLGLVIAVIVVGVFIVLSTVFHTHGVPAG